MFTQNSPIIADYIHPTRLYLAVKGLSIPSDLMICVIKPVKCSYQRSMKVPDGLRVAVRGVEEPWELKRVGYH